MKASLPSLAAWAVFVPWCAAAAPADTRDFVYLGDTRPLLVRLHLEIHGQPLGAAWDEFIGEVFQYLDVNRDGVLSREEAEKAPPPQFFFSNGFLGNFSAPSMDQLDANRDGKVTREELANYYRQNGGGPFHFQVGQFQGTAIYGVVGQPGGQNPMADQINEVLFKLLDADKDGKLSRAELAAAPERLLKLDADDDEIVTLAELVSDLQPAANQVFVGGGRMTQPVVTGSPFLPLNPGDSTLPLVRRLQERYGRKGNKKLTCKELGMDQATFDQLDADGDGELDGEELGRFARRPADLEFSVRLGASGETAGKIDRVAPGGKPSPLASSIQKAGGGAILVDLGGTRLTFRSDNQTMVAAVANYRQFYQSQFRVADRDNNGYLDMKEAQQSPYFRTLFKLMDADNDGKLFEKEMLAYLDRMEKLQAKAAASCASLQISDAGRGLFDLLDTDRDGRLSVRELRNAAKLIDVLDRDGDGRISKEEIPRNYDLALKSGPPNQFAVRTVVVGAYGMSATAGGQPTAGPVWFRKMDRNRDGDVSRREFLGTDEEFRRIDTDGDGLISVEEAERADAQFRKKDLKAAEGPKARTAP